MSKTTERGDHASPAEEVRAAVTGFVLTDTHAFRIISVGTEW